jgi:hypothetical protein
MVELTGAFNKVTSESDNRRHCPTRNPSEVKGPIATRLREITSRPKAAIMRRIWRFRPENRVISYPYRCSPRPMSATSAACNNSPSSQIPSIIRRHSGSGSRASIQTS